MKALAVLALLLFAAPLGAGVPSPANSTIPKQIPVVGMFGGQPDTATGAVEVVVRDLANNPVAGALVTIDFGTVPDVRLAPDMLDPELTVQCASSTVTAYTNAAGRARFTILGAGRGTSAQDGVIRARVSETGRLLGEVPVVIYDLDGVNGVGANDLALWLQDIGSLENRGRGDYDGSGFTGANDISVWLGVAGRWGSAQSTPLLCP